MRDETNILAMIHAINRKYFAPKIVALSLVCAASIPIAIWLVSSQFFNTNIFLRGQWGLAPYLNGTVWRPYAYRVMTPWIIQATLALHLSALKIPYLDRVVLATCPNMHAIPAATCEQVKAYAIVAMLSASGFLIATYVAAIRFFENALWGVTTIVAAVVSVNALMLQQSSHIYDFPVLFLSTLLFLLAHRQQDVQFGAAFVIACLTKESLSLFVLVYAFIGYGTRPRREIIRNILVQSTLFVGIYAFERARFASNNGSPMYHNIRGHLNYLQGRVDLPSTLELIVFLIVLLYRFPVKPPVLRRSMMIIPIILVLYVVGGNPGEFRVVFDIFPIVLLPIVDSLRRLTFVADA